jgi:ParB-like nuclease domain
MPDIIATILIKDIAINGRRELNAESVTKLADSIKKVGLRHPITVRRRNGAYILVAGRHRIEACKRLGLDHISASIATMTEEESRLWEIAENLHRAELTKLERDENIAEWIKITEGVSAQVAPKPQGGRPEGGVRAASRELGIDEDDGRRAVKVASISEEAKEAARDAGIDNNRSALLSVAKEATPEAQVAKVAEIADAKVLAKDATPVDDDEESPRVITDFVDADVPGAAATNKLIKKVFRLFEGPLFEAWIENNPDEEAVYALIEAMNTCTSDVEGRVLAPILKQRREQQRADNKTSRAYNKKFGPYHGVPNHDLYRLMEASLKSGIDELAETKREHREHSERMEREREESLRQPCTPEMEQKYTALIKKRQLYEGACELSWAQYFKYRDQHPDLSPLDQDDLDYAGMWTPFAMPEFLEACRVVLGSDDPAITVAAFDDPNLFAQLRLAAAAAAERRVGMK